MSQTRISPDSKVSSLLNLAHSIGLEDRGLAMLGEGNVSTRLDEEKFLVKASGSNLRSLREEDVVECRFEVVLDLMDQQALDDAAVDAALLASRVDPKAKKPSVEALFHAYLLSLPGVEYVGHTHPMAINSFLCSPQAEVLALTRIFPDEIVCCGEESVFVPYEDPGLKLSQRIRDGVEKFNTRRGENPRVILLKNHGIITFGPTPQSVEAAMLMAEKAARIRLGAQTLGGIVSLTDAEVARISHRPDEHVRRRALGI